LEQLLQSNHCIFSIGIRYRKIRARQCSESSIRPTNGQSFTPVKRRAKKPRVPRRATGASYTRQMPRKNPEAHPAWVLYLLECGDGTYYAGITTDLARRFAEHQAGSGARYTRARKAVRVIASMSFADRSSASVAEAQLKKLPRASKPEFFGSCPAKKGKSR
jgi:putative endonuclease